MAYVRSLKVKSSSGALHHYLKIVESVREQGKVKQRVIANLGNVKVLSPHIKAIVQGLLQACGETKLSFAEDGRLVAVREYGVRYVVEQVWQQLDLGKIIAGELKKRKVQLAYGAWMRMMVVNKLSDPTSKLGLLRWLSGVYWPEPGFSPALLSGELDEKEQLQRGKREVTKLYRAMDYLLALKEPLEQQLYWKLRDLFSLSVDLVFYDLTSSYFEGEGPEGLAAEGYSRDHEPGKQQVVIGLILCNGLPIGHEVFEGNRVDKKTVKEVLRHLQERFQIKQCIFIGDRGLISTENVQALEAANFDSILALQRRRNREVRQLLLGQGRLIYGIESKELWWREVKGETGVRYVVCYNPRVAEEQKQRRRQALTQLKQALDTLKQKVEAGKKKPSNKTLVRRIEQVLRHKHGRRVIDYRLEPGPPAFVYWEKAAAVQLEEALDGVYILRTKDQTLTTVQIIEAYKDLMYVERAFRTMKSVLDLRPFWHRIEDRIRAHALICYLGLLIHRYVERALQAAGYRFSADHAFASLKHLGAAIMQIEGKQYTFVSEPTVRQLSVFKALALKTPTRCIVEKH